MKPRQLIFWMFFTAMLFTNKTKAQEFKDYVITIKGDSIPCKVKRSFFIGKIKYISAKDGITHQLSTDSVIEYYTQSDKILHKAILVNGENTVRFKTVIEKGKINLYEQVVEGTVYNGTTTMYTRTTSWYVSKGTDTAVFIKTDGLSLGKSKSKRKDILAQLLMDNKPVYNRFIAEDDFSFKQIKLIVHLYNTGKSIGE